MALDPMGLLDPEITAILDSAPPQKAWDPQAMRKQGAALLDNDVDMPAGVKRKVVHIDSDGNQLELRVFIPTGADEQSSCDCFCTSAPNGVILSMHGGGLIAGAAKYDDSHNAELVLQSGAVVASPEYRLAPENPYPAALHDCRNAWLWLVDTFATDTRVIYGDSAGGTLAAGLITLLRDKGDTMPTHAVLIEPVLDDRLDTVSMRDNTPIWNRPNAQASWKAYLGDTPADQYAAPARTDDYTGWPPTFLMVNQCDPLRDEDLRLGVALTESNVAVEMIMLPQTCHGILGLQGPTVAQRARDYVSAWLARIFK